MDWAMQDIVHLVEEVRAYHAIDSPVFPQRKHREAAHASRKGLLATLPRKSIEPMVLAVDGVAPGPYGPCSPVSVPGSGRMSGVPLAGTLGPMH